MDGTGTRLARLLPPPGVPRTIAFQSAVSAVGSGAFLTGGVVFFIHVLGLTPLQIGAGLSVSGLTSLVASLPLGALADRLGGRRSWAGGAVLSAAAFALFPFATSVPAFLAVLIVTAAADTLAGAGRTIYTADAIPPEGRVRTMAFARTYLNIGFAVGTGLGAMVLAFDDDAVLTGMILGNAALLLVNAAVVTRLPAPPARVVEPGEKAVAFRRLAVLRDVPYVVFGALVGALLFHAYLMTEILPLWVVTNTDAPKPVLGALFALNTALVILLQVPATRGTESMSGTTRLLRRAGLATALACPVAALSGRTSGWWTVAALVVVIVLTTGTELWLSAADWFFQTNVPPPALRGAYVGLGHLIGSVSGMLAPVGLTLLAIQTGGWGWWVIAALFLGCSAVAGPVVGWVARTPRVDGRRHHEPAAPVAGSAS